MKRFKLINMHAKQIPQTPHYRYARGDRNFTENEWFQIVKRSGYAIRNIKNPSEEMKLATVKKMHMQLTILRIHLKKYN